MSRTNKGGTRLRLVVAFAITTAVSAGVLAAYGHFSPAPRETVSLALPAAAKGGSATMLTITGLPASATTYYVKYDSAGLWDLSASGNGLSASTPAGFSGTNNTFSFTTDGNGKFNSSTNGEADIYFATVNTSSTVAAAKLRLYSDSGATMQVGSDSSTMPIYVLSFTGTDSLVDENTDVHLVVSGLVSSENVDISPVNTSNNLDSSAWSVGTGGAGTSSNGYQFPSPNYIKTLGASSSSLNTYFRAGNLNQDFTTRYRLSINGITIGISGNIVVQDQG